MAEPGSDDASRKRQQPPPIVFVKPGEEAPAPQAPSQPPAAWVPRPEDFKRPAYAAARTPTPTRAPGPGRIAQFAVATLILAAVVSIGNFLYSSLTPLSPAQNQNLTNDTALYALGEVCALLSVWGQAVAILAGVMVMQRINYRFAVSAAFFGMFGIAAFGLLTLDPVMMLAAFLAVIGFSLVVIARREFVS